MSVNSKLKYHKLSKELQERIISDRESGWINPYRCDDSAAIRRDMDNDNPNLWRPTFVRDTEKILHLPVYNRYADKTQVFSLYNNDDITRRALHVQLVSRIARNIGKVLGLNLDLIEATALGHDLGHTPFGHAGERFLSELLHNETGRFFNHNVHSVRVLDKIFSRNLTLQTLDGILCHNGEFELKEYKPQRNKDFEILDKEVEDCYVNGESAIEGLIPATLEGCVVRICDMIAYIGKDRQDARVANIIDSRYKFENDYIGTENAAIINNLTVDIIEHSYGKDYILLSSDAFRDLKTAKRENAKVIYMNEGLTETYDNVIKPMFRDMYYSLLDDVIKRSTDSIIYKHHILFTEKARWYYTDADRVNKYEEEEPNQIVTDFIASMTDDYFIALYERMFPDSKYKIEYKSYFDDIDKR